MTWSLELADPLPVSSTLSLGNTAVGQGDQREYKRGVDYRGNKEAIRAPEAAIHLIQCICTSKIPLSESMSHSIVSKHLEITPLRDVSESWSQIKLLNDLEVCSDRWSTALDLVSPSVLPSVVDRHASDNRESDTGKGNVDRASFLELGLLLRWESTKR